MTRTELEAYIAETYNTDPDYPWEDSPDAAVFRHGNNRKWFALIMNVSKSRLGLPGEGNVDIVNLRCGPLMTGSLLLELGFLPAYHMSKTNWGSAVLDGSAEDERIRLVLDVSFDGTAAKRRKI